MQTKDQQHLALLAFFTGQSKQTFICLFSQSTVPRLKLVWQHKLAIQLCLREGDVDMERRLCEHLNCSTLAGPAVKDQVTR